MPKNSKIIRPEFQSEAEEADWYHTAQGRTYMQQSLRKAAREGRLKINNGATGKPPTAEEAKQLLEQVRHSLLQPVNLRLPQGDLDAARQLAKKTGRKYQAILKEIIHEGLQQRLAS